jgi:hypothetical protein
MNRTPTIQAPGTVTALTAVTVVSCCLSTSSVTESHPAVSGRTSAENRDAIL